MENSAQEVLNYTTINHTAREKLQLGWVEYGLLDLVHNLSNNPLSENRWCYASKEKIATMLGVTRQYVQKIIVKAIEKNLLEKHPETKHLRTTQLWYDTVVIKAKRDSKQSLQGVNKVDTDSKQSLHQSVNKVDTAIYDKDINKENYNNTGTSVPVKKLPEKSEKSIVSLTENSNTEESSVALKKVQPGSNKLDNRNPDITELMDMMQTDVGHLTKANLNRYAVHRLIRDKGKDRVIKAWQYAMEHRDDQFCPSISNFMDLEEKWVDLETYGRRKAKTAASVPRAVNVSEIIRRKKEAAQHSYVNVHA